MAKSHSNRGCWRGPIAAFLYIDEVNLLEDHLVDLLLDVAASGENLIEREGLSLRHPARFVLIGSGNPEEGELRPQLLDRFGLAVEVATPTDIATRVEVVLRRDAFERDPSAFAEAWRPEEQKLRRRIVAARERLSSSRDAGRRVGAGGAALHRAGDRWPARRVDVDPRGARARQSGRRGGGERRASAPRGAAGAVASPAPQPARRRGFAGAGRSRASRRLSRDGARRLRLGLGAGSCRGGAVCCRSFDEWRGAARQPGPGARRLARRASRLSARRDANAARAVPDRRRSLAWGGGSRRVIARRAAHGRVGTAGAERRRRGRPRDGRAPAASRCGAFLRRSRSRPNPRRARRA